MENYKSKCIKLLEERGVTINDIAECSLYLQKSYHKDISRDDFLQSIDSVLNKTEVQFAIMIAIELDKEAESKQMFNKDLETSLNNDEPMFGVDEVLAYGICNLYGSIALTNFGYIDKEKYGIIAKLNDPSLHGKVCNCFLDDVVGAIAAAAASRFAHNF